MTPVAVEIHRDPERLEELAPLYSALLAHHASLPNVPLAQPVEQSWPLRRAEYTNWLANHNGFVSVARRDGDAVGYAVVSIADGPDDMWVTGDRIAEVQSLCVRPSERSAGIGSALLNAIEAELGHAGVRDIQIAVLATNADALRLYERRGFIPRLTVLSNYARRSE